ncbi:hypothetical protein FT663_02740 [Candidozyma haemuli var. vulneris]|uniref:C2H2-type domain-containing protein n=1 Tax=Candidozyma haemuli TaxID=45357 RepID=A0A2V1ANJ6_9ASCO|nr:hypothetical protein CXQ85_001444 [[Candida] haemuloni]KAF3989646.1 hypothetical protein FT662_02725 [[Candida] haemuloni var. vulneris]KAF3991442.1 hypothetical protein FT663_02740 [[Candida] haemuloni var. vulneris]PVH19146.1 hypothetical protein CXQ85_001444 [[Candida] haemuloni]
MNGNTASPEGVYYREDHPEAPNSGASRHATSTDDFDPHITGGTAPDHAQAVFDSKMPQNDFNGMPSFQQDSGLMLQMDSPSQDYLNWNMPGAFRQDAMDMDQSPVMENGMYVDSNTGLGDPLREDDGSFMQFVKEQNAQRLENSGFPDNTQNDFNIDSLSQQQHHQHSNPSSSHTKFEDSTPANFDHDNPSTYGDAYGDMDGGLMDENTAFESGISPAKAFGSLVDESPHAEASSVDAFSSIANKTPEADDHSHPARSRRNTQSHRTSISAVGADFSPLTTTTSLTPSMNSVYSAQASFFSANQFHRSSFEQPPSSIHRPSFDVYPRGRVSLDSQGSSINPPSRNPRSFSSYIPFMGERDRDRKQQSPDWGQQQHQQPQQPRHLIRSIFKSNNEQPEDDPAPFLADVLVDQDEDGDMHQDTAENPVPSKKAKRTRMNLFNRFKTGKNQPLEPQPELVKQETHSSVASSERDDSSHQNSSVVQHSLQNSVKTANSSNSGNVQMVDAQPPPEPDYASLFENMGKRRLGGMKNKKPTVKQEPDSGIGSSVSATEKSSLNHANRSSAEQSGDSRSANSVSLSQHSSISEEFAAAGASSSFANASKRILGSRLLKKKAQHAKAEAQQSDVVEIDLQSLDLPPDTEIVPTINPKVRTRGRKENKAADMVDSSKIFVCTYCLRRFKRQEHLKRHFRSLHTTEKPYECPTCQKKFSRTDNLNQHIKVHKQEEEEAAARAAGIIKEEDYDAVA